MLPASLAGSLFLKRGGGAKSSAVKVPDFLNACLVVMSDVKVLSILQEESQTHGLGITGRSSNEDARGKCAGSIGE